MVGLQAIHEAKIRIAPYIHRTPLVSSAFLSQQAGSEVFLKAELFQKTGSFKVRGAFNNALSLSQAELDKGVICFSSGNHAQAVAYAGRALGTKAVVVMPEATNPVKIRGCEGYGASIVLYGKSTLDIEDKANSLIAEQGYSLIHPFNGDRTLAGQGTLGLEILEDLPDADTIYVPIGCGGLISGVAIAVKSLSANIKVIGVEPETANAMYRCREAGKRVELDDPHSIADGLLSKLPGEDAFAAVSACVDDIILVSEAEIEQAQLHLMNRTKLFAEASGAVALAGLLSGRAARGKKNVAVVSGGNVNPVFLSSLLAR